jgi:hypothetical protein
LSDGSSERHQHGDDADDDQQLTSVKAAAARGAARETRATTRFAGLQNQRLIVVTF